MVLQALPHPRQMGLGLDTQSLKARTIAEARQF